MKVFIQGQGSVSLTKNDFLGRGGQGEVYAKGPTAYKLYDDPSRMIPVAKIGELAAITDPNVIRPQAVLTDAKGNPVGYTMRFVRDAYTLCQTFTKAFRQRAGLTPEKSLALVRKLQASIAHIHSKRILVVDLNELNFLVDQCLAEIYSIDVDSYQTPGYHASALMESVRDRHARPNQFTEATDWFAFAIVSWQMFIGIHPYKGRHPQFGDDMDERMKHNLSVLNPEVKYPKGVVLPFDVIPPSYRRWYEAVLERGERSAPPDDNAAPVAVAQRTQAITQGAAVDIVKLLTLPEEIVAYFDSPVQPVTITTTAFYLGGRRVDDVPPRAVVAHALRTERPIAAWTEGGKLRLFDLLAKRAISIDLDASHATVSDRRLYTLSGSNLLEIQFLKTTNAIMASTQIVGAALELATHVGDGVMLQNLLGSFYASVFPFEGLHYQVRLKELDGAKILESRYRNRVLAVVASKGGRYDRYVFRFASDYGRTYDVHSVRDITPTGLNFVVHENGTAVMIDEEAQIQVFSNQPGSLTSKLIKDPAIGVDMRLGIKGSQTIFWKDDSLYTMSMKRNP